MTKQPPSTWANNIVLSELAVTVASLTIIGMLCTIGVETVVIIGHYFGAP